MECKGKLTNILLTGLAMAAILCAGINEGGLGATLPDLAFITSSTTASIATVFSWRSLASILGSILTGIVLDIKGSGGLVLGVCLLCQGIMSLLIPWCPNIVILGIANAVSAFFTNGIIVGSCSMCFLLWNSELAPPLIQATRLSFSLGTTVAPPLVGAFLGIYNYTGLVENGTESSTIPHNCHQNDNISTYQCTDVYVAYTVLGFLDICLGIVAFFILIASTRSCFVSKRNKDKGQDNITYGSLETRKNKDLTKSTEEFANERTLLVASEKKDTPIAKGSQEISEFLQQLRHKHVIIPLTFVLLAMISYGGLEMTMIGLSVTYANTVLGWSLSNSVKVLTIYQATKLAANLPVVFVSKKVNSFWILVMDMAVILIISIVFLSTIKFWDTIFFIFVIGLAFGTSNIFASSLSYVQEVVTVKGKVTGSFNVAFALGGLAFPALCGLLLDMYGILVFPAVLLGCSILWVILLVLSKVLLKVMRQDDDKVHNRGVLDG